jgi:glycosyltransferase involved in cell wall biosynthesis
LKILYHHRTGSRDGQAVHIQELIHAFRELGCEVVVVEPPATAGSKFGHESSAFAWLRRALPKACYELLEFGYNIPVYLRLRRAFIVHRPDILYERYNLFLVAGAWLRRRYRIPYLLEVNAPLFRERQENDGLALARLAQWTERAAWRQADFVLPVTRVLGGMVAAEGVPKQRIAPIPNGINLASFSYGPAVQAAKRALGLEDRLVLGFTGFVRTWHRLDRVIEFLAREKERRFHLLVVGDGPAKQELVAQAAALGVSDCVQFTGVIARDHVASYIQAFDIALQPAATEYASPLKLFEYMAMGCAIVAPAQPNILEVLTDGLNAALFDPSDAEAMCRAIGRLADDPLLRERLAQHARASIVEGRYTWLDNARRVLALAHQLASAERAPVPAGADL